MERLDNGLTVILQALSYSPVAAVNIAYRAGSLWETDGTRGYSHLCEHMMFKGSREYAPGEYWRVVQRNGGVANAYTSRDITLYYSVLPRAGLQDILRLEADRMFHCDMRNDHVASETAVILEEELLTRRDDPEGSLDSLLYSTAFTEHPYGKPITGTADDIRSFNPKRLREFYRNFYSPGNAVISVVGDIGTGEVLQAVGNLFGGGNRDPVERPEVNPEPDQTHQMRAEIEHPSQLPGMAIGFRVPEGDHPDSAPLSLISLYLSSGRSSRFEKLLVKPSLVLDVSTSTNTHIMPGLFVVRTVLPENGSTLQVEELIFDELERLADIGIDDEALQILKRRRTAWSMISDADPPGRSRRFSTGFSKFGDTYYYWNSIRSLLSVTPEDIMRAAARYLAGDNSTVAVMRSAARGILTRPTLAGKAAEPEPDITPPALQPPWEMDIPDALLQPPESSVADGVREITLKNGLRLILRRDVSFPIVSVGFSCRMGSSMEPQELTGLAQITAETMLYGTPDLDSIEFNARLENLGASMDFSSTSEYSGGVITTLSRDFDKVLSVISDMLRNPAFRLKDLDSVRSDAISSLEEWIATPLGAAMNSFSRQSTDPPEMSSVPTRETLEAIGRNHLLEFHRGFCRPDGTLIVVVGNFSEEEIEVSVRRHFSGWDNPETSRTPAPAVMNSRLSSETGIQLPGREQIALVIGSPAPPRLHEDSYAISILSRILGEGIGSRLGRNIREIGLSYHVSSMYIPLSDRGRLATLVLTSPNAFRQAMETLRHELRKVTAERVSSSELRLEKASYIGLQELSMMKYSSIARILLTYASLDLPLDHDRITMRRVCDITRDDILQAAGRWLGTGISYVSYAGGIEP
ncbi:MAG: insulinase family protein [Candidatus Fermentibacteraceae bacterium]|nr:insulinase family protein [Candidatus Fermentibacteraceae bacterium]